jgi:hypothetical protein
LTWGTLGRWRSVQEALEASPSTRTADTMVCSRTPEDGRSGRDQRRSAAAGEVDERGTACLVRPVSGESGGRQAQDEREQGGREGVAARGAAGEVARVSWSSAGRS